MCPSACPRASPNLGWPGGHALVDAFFSSENFHQESCESIQNTPKPISVQRFRQNQFLSENSTKFLSVYHLYIQSIFKPNNSSLHLDMIEKYNICWLWFAYLFRFILQQSIYLKNCGNRNAKSNQLDCKHFFSSPSLDTMINLSSIVHWMDVVCILVRLDLFSFLCFYLFFAFFLTPFGVPK